MNGRIKVDSSGQVIAEGKQTASALANHKGSFELLSTSPDLLLWVRSPAQGGIAAKPRVVLAGDAANFPISDLIAFLAQSKWSGVFQVHSPNGERTVVFKDGEVRGATSDDPADRLGEILVRLGYVKQDKVDRALHEHPPSKVGRALVEKGDLKAHDLYKCLTHQVSEIFDAIVLSREGVFCLIDQELDVKSSAHSLELSTQNLLMDSIRKIDEMAHFRKRIPHGRLYVARRRLSDGKLEEEEERVLALCSGAHTVLEIGQQAKLSEFDVTKIVYRLLEGGYAATSEQPNAAGAPAQAPPQDHAGAGSARVMGKASDPEAVAKVYNAVFKQIRDELAKKGSDKEFIAAANAALATEALSTSPVLKDLKFDATGFLPEKKLLAQYRSTLAAAPDGIQAFRQALSDVMFFLLFQAAELLERDADEALARRVKELLATLEG